MGTGKFIAGGNPSMDYHPIQGGVEILLVASWPTKTGISSRLIARPLDPYADFISVCFSYTQTLLNQWFVFLCHQSSTWTSQETTNFTSVGTKCRMCGSRLADLKPFFFHKVHSSS